MRILFIDPCNGHEVRKTLVEVSKKFSRKQLEELEALQPGRGRSGGD